MRDKDVRAANVIEARVIEREACVIEREGCVVEREEVEGRK